MKVKEFLFKGFKGCSNHGCLIKDRSGMGTNGSCRCITDLNRSQLQILSSRLRAIKDEEVFEKNDTSTTPK